jgi:hypothetical protein
MPEEPTVRARIDEAVAEVHRLKAMLIPAVKVGDVIRVHVPKLPDLWRVDELLYDPSSHARFLRISQNNGMVKRIISPRGFEIVSGTE